MIYTSYFAKIKDLEANGIKPIAICRKAPDWYNGELFVSLAPSEKLLNAHKYGNLSEDDFIERYYDEVLNKMKLENVIASIEELAGYNDIAESKEHHVALMCWEAPGKLCHRILVGIWLQALGVDCQEWEKSFTAGDS